MNIAIAAAALLAALVPAALDAAPVTATATAVRLPEATWLNPRGSVAVRTGRCGDRLCGWVVWASAKAQADARKGGVTRLVGTALLENYRPTGRGHWSGTVYIPDMDRRFSSAIDQVSADRLKVKGCILGGLVCKSQVWTRIDHLPAADAQQQRPAPAP